MTDLVRSRGEPWLSIVPDDTPAIVAEVETRLRAIEERFRFLAENAQDFVFRYRIRPDPGFDYVSPACEAITGYSPDELYADPELIFEMLEAHYVEMMRETHRATELSRPWELCMRRKDRSTIWVEQRLTLVRDDDFRIVAVEGIARDVTSRKLAEDR